MDQNSLEFMRIHFFAVDFIAQKTETWPQLQFILIQLKLQKSKQLMFVICTFLLGQIDLVEIKLDCRVVTGRI